jgi:hypothetical protein
MIMKKVSMVTLAVLGLSLSAWAQTPPLHLKVVGDVQTNKSLKIL